MEREQCCIMYAHVNSPALRFTYEKRGSVCSYVVGEREGDALYLRPFCNPYVHCNPSLSQWTRTNLLRVLLRAARSKITGSVIIVQEASNSVSISEYSKPSIK
jgi:hypothetical protein